jgi:hypothetical protein
LVAAGGGLETGLESLEPFHSSSVGGVQVDAVRSVFECPPDAFWKDAPLTFGGLDAPVAAAAADFPGGKEKLCPDFEVLFSKKSFAALTEIGFAGWRVEGWEAGEETEAALEAAVRRAT